MKKPVIGFLQKVTDRLDGVSSHLCVGLDPHMPLIPSEFHSAHGEDQTIFNFNKMIVDATKDLAVAYKINISLYLNPLNRGLNALKQTNEYVREVAPEIPIFADFKISEMGWGNDALNSFLFDLLKFDCIMVTPWFGYDALKEFIVDRSKGVVVYVHDSNPSASDLQDLSLANGKKLYEAVAEMVNQKWNKNGNILVEAGATYPHQLRKVREIVGNDMPIVTAGIGPQGGKPEDLVGCFGKNGKRLIVSCSRSITFPDLKSESYADSVRKAAINMIAALQEVSYLKKGYS